MMKSGWKYVDSTAQGRYRSHSGEILDEASPINFVRNVTAVRLCIYGIFLPYLLTAAACNAGIDVLGKDDPEAKLALVELDLALGEDDARQEYQFASILDMVVTDDDVLWVLDGDGYIWNSAETPMLRRYDANGNYLGLVGRQGEGPAEYSAPYALAALPDGRVALRDARAGDRITIYTADGVFHATWLSHGVQTWPFNGGYALEADTNGIVWYPFRFNTRRTTDSERGFLRLRSDGTVLDTVPFPRTPEVKRDELRVVRTTASGGQSIRGFTVPYQPSGTMTWSPVGHFAVAATNAYRVMVLPPPAVASLDPQDFATMPRDQVRIISRDLRGVEISVDEREAARERLVKDVTEYGAAGEVEIPEMPQEKPLLRGLRYGADGRLWVWVSMPSRFDNGQWTEPYAFDVFEPDGRFVGRVVLPDSFSVVFMKGDHMWGRHIGEYDVESVRRYRIGWR